MTNHEKESGKIPPHLFFATTLNTSSKDEDGPPVAIAFSVEQPGGHHGALALPSESIKIQVCSVADGAGRAGSTRYKSFGDREVTGAFIGARAAQAVVQDMAMNYRSELTRSTVDIKQLLEGLLQNEFATLPTKYPSDLQRPQGVLLRFPTTLAATVMQERAQDKSLMLFWQGDSPIIVLTPDKIYTTHSTGGTGYAHIDGCVSSDTQSLKSHELRFPKDMPVVAIAASDGILEQEEPVFQNTLQFIINALQDIPSSADFLRQLQESYSEIRWTGERDDTTLAVSASISSFEELKELKVNTPIDYL